MLHILTITSPIYLIIALGYAIVRLNLMQKPEIRAMGRFVFMIGMPALLFNALTQNYSGVEIDWNYVLVYAIGSMATMWGVILYARRVRKSEVVPAGIQGMAAAAANTAFIGFPVLVQLIGPLAGIGLAMCMIVENILIMPVALAYADSGKAKGRAGAALMHSLASLVRNPLLWGLALGLLFNMLGWSLPAVPERMVQMLAQIASPLALFVVGGSLVGLRLGHQLRDVFSVVGAKLFVHPALVAVALLFFPSIDRTLAVAAVVFAAMPTAALVTVLAQRHQQDSFTAGVLLVGTTLSFITITLLLMLVAPMLPALS